MKRMLSLCAAALCLTLTLTPTALADGGIFKMPNAFGERLAVRALIDPHAQTQRGDLDLAEGTVYVVELTRHICEQHSGLIAVAAAHRTPWGNHIAVAADHGASRGKGARRKIRRQVFAGMQRIHALRAKDGRNERCVLAHIFVAHGAAIRRVNDIDGGIPAEVVIVRRIDTVFQRIRRSRQSCCHAKAQAKGDDLFHSSVSSSSAFSLLRFTSSAPPTPAPAAATTPMGMST